MRKKTISILAVAFSASTVACGGATDTTVGHPGQQQSAAQGEAATSTTGPAEEGASQKNEEQAGTAPAPTPPDPAPAACDRDALNEELTMMTTDGAVAKHEHFRCLCDDEGYPLVGNINSKGATASSFCTAIREKGLL